jgi:hypothetical protein
MPSQIATLSLAEKFCALVKSWKLARGPTSSIEKMSMHSAYQQIIGIGPDAVPLLLAELEREPDHWFWALRSITGADPIPEDARGNLAKMAQAWLAWGKAQGYGW